MVETYQDFTASETTSGNLLESNPSSGELELKIFGDLHIHTIDGNFSAGVEVARVCFGAVESAIEGEGNDRCVQQAREERHSGQELFNH